MAVKSSYGASADEVAELYGDYLEGDASRCALAVSAQTLGGAARNAIERSLESFGYAGPTCTYATLVARDAAVEGGDVTLDPQALFLLVEGLDPLYVIAADEAAAKQVALAYRAAFDLDAPTRILGRPAAIFADLDTLVGSETGKHRAWKVLRTLGKQ